MKKFLLFLSLFSVFFASSVVHAMERAPKRQYTKGTLMCTEILPEPYVEELFDAVAAGHMSTVMRLLPQVDINIRYEGFTLLRVAVNKKQHAIAQLLLDRKGVGVLVQDKDGDTPLMEAIYRDDVRMVELLLRYGGSRQAQVDARDSSGNTPLHIALEAGMDENQENIGIIGLLLQAGADITAKNNENPDGDTATFEETPVHYAAKHDRALAVCLMVLYARLPEEIHNANARGNMLAFDLPMARRLLRQGNQGSELEAEGALLPSVIQLSVDRAVLLQDIFGLRNMEGETAMSIARDSNNPLVRHCLEVQNLLPAILPHVNKILLDYARRSD